MRAAERVKRDLENQCPITKDQLISEVEKRLRNNGYTQFCVYDSISKFHFENGMEFPTKYADLAMKWIREEGFYLKRLPFPGEQYEIIIF